MTSRTAVQGGREAAASIVTTSPSGLIMASTRRWRWATEGAKPSSRSAVTAPPALATEPPGSRAATPAGRCAAPERSQARSEEHTSELQSLRHLVCRLLLEKKNSNMFRDSHV